MTEVDAKVERLARLAHREGLAGVLITLQPNFAWLTGGASNRINASTEAGAGSLLVTADGARHVIANTIEMPRLLEEALNGLGFEPREYPWTADHLDPPAVVAVARTLTGGASIGADALFAGVASMAAAVSAAQTPLTDQEIERYRRLGRDVARALETVCRGLPPGITESDVATRVGHAVARIGARAIVTLVGADQRIGRYRHPVPTDTTWRRTLLIGLCAERHGLVVSLSRIVSAEPPSSDLTARTRATALVFGRLIAATRAGASGADLYRAAAGAYEAVGFASEETRHHQGGAIGYRSRDWIAHPLSRQQVQSRQAFAWNPSITGTKVEDTALLVDDDVEMVTSTTEWPGLEVPGRNGSLRAPDILVL
jgi:Xaa-Pro aminopeptidase